MVPKQIQAIRQLCAFNGERCVMSLALFFILAALVSQGFYLCFTSIHTDHNLLGFLFLFSILASLMSAGFTLVSKRTNYFYFVVYYLVSTFFLLIALRLCSYTDMIVSIGLWTIALVLKIINFVCIARLDLKELDNGKNSILYRHCSRYEWQVLFIRLFIGFDLVPHFCEKLFAGSAIRSVDIHAFTQLGVPHPEIFVWIAGVIEFLAAMAIGCGILTRFASLLFVIYLLVATYLGHHFSLGFIWASQGGGWEYPVLWSSLITSFAFFGAGGFSIDHVLRERFKLPRSLMWLMGSRHW